MKIPEPEKGRLKHPLDPRDQERLHWKGRGVVSFSSPSPRLAWCHTDRVPWAYGVTSEKRKSKVDIQSPSVVEHFPVSTLGSSFIGVSVESAGFDQWRADRDEEQILPQQCLDPGDKDTAFS